MAGPLTGVKILDFTRYQQGPYATVMLSDLGATVLKVEPREGDPGRSLGLKPDGWCAYFEAHDRNKRSITIDVRKPEGKAIVYKLVQEYDVVTDNFRPSVMKRLELDYDALSKINPRVITATATGFGPEGPYAHRPSFDSMGQAMGGIMSVQGGGPDEPPEDVMGGLADQVGAMVFALGISSAIIARERQGIGQHVDVSLFGSQLALQTYQLTGMMRDGSQHKTPHRLMPTFTYYRCQDGKYLSLGILIPKWWEALCRILGREDLSRDERFEDAHRRQRNREALLAELDAAFQQRPREEWLALLMDADVPCGPVNDYAALATEPQALENGYIASLEHPSLGRVGVVGSPIKMTKTPAGPAACAPELGQHTEEVLLELGYDWAAIERLKVAEVI